MEENQAVKSEEKVKNKSGPSFLSILTVLLILGLVFSQIQIIMQNKINENLFKMQIASNELVLKEIKETKKQQALIEQEFVVLYDFISRMNSTTNIIEDNIQRIYHYVAPHKHDLSNSVCPECFDLRKKQKKHEEPVTAEELLKE